jgi:hypothetical protein
MTGYLPRVWLLLDPSNAIDPYPYDRIPAVWKSVLEDLYIVVAGRTYLDHNPDLEIVQCRILDSASLELARAEVRPVRSPRPSLPSARRLLERASKLPDLSPEERAFLAALDYMTTGLVKGWPSRIASLDGPHPDR